MDLGSARPSRWSLGLELLWCPLPWLEAAVAARPRVSGPVEEVLARWLGPEAFGERGGRMTRP